MSNVSYDLIWEVARNQNSFLVKRKTNGGVQLSRDPMNLTNVHSKKYAGFANEKAVGLVPASNGGVTLLTKKPSAASSPAKSTISVTFPATKDTRRTFKAVATATAVSGYRPDLREAAIQRASSLKHATKPVKASPEAKPRGKKAL
ncbi:putative 60S ribosomal protein L28e [Ceratocystis fimbriata CBS 114723]|uniref:Putative 60S ribosomal protein L28e n=1 Tax=Ceratocystis fimbriata CBS 114723 TaxID=1035309 RepID=A0A2C5WT93_9PEZI|nr:putative 60S ribosomal protein L28e [Ceratocystis fimbriata CBS 114723]